MIGKKINQLATELAPVSTDLTIIGDPDSGVSKKITLAQLGAIFSGAVSFYTNLASFPAVGDINVIYCAKDTQKLYLWSGSAYVEVFPSQALLNTYQLRSEKGVSNGYASLDSAGKVPISQLPSSIMEYKGTWNASTNTPTLANGTGDTGDVYICNVAGTVNFGAGPITFAVGDYVIYSGTIWQRSSGAVGTVTSVAASITGDAIGITGSPITTSGTLALAFAGTSAQYINGAGNLTTFPTSLVSGSGASGQVTFFNGANSVTGTNNFFWDATNNRLGIGTTTPQRSIEIYNTTADNHLRLSGNAPSVSMGEAVTGSVYQAKFGLVTTNGQFVSAGVAGDFVIISQTGATIIGTSSTEKMRVNTSGNVSINNTNNTYKLDVTGTGRYTGQLRLESTITDGTNTYTLPSATGTLALTSQLTGGTVTSVGLSSATSGVTIGSTPITTSGTITLAIATASGSQQGLLSSTDWTTFNNKQSALTNPVTGTGTTNYLPKFTGTSTIGNSIVSESGSIITIAGSLYSSGTLRLTGSSSVDFQAYTGSAYSNLNYDAASHNWQTSGGTAKMILNASGNLGLGVTPSAWNSAFGSVLQFKSAGSNGGGSLTGSGGSNFRMFANTFYDGSYKYIVNGTATQYEQDGYHAWYNAPSGTAGNAISFTQAMTLDANGRLGIGSTSPSQKLVVQESGDAFIQIRNNTAGQNLFIGALSTETRLNNDNATPLTFWVNGSERFRIASTGAATFSSSVTAVGFVANMGSTNTEGLLIQRANTSSNAIIKFKNNTTDTWILGNRNTGDETFRLYNYNVGADVITVTNGGNVGIGTTSPGTSKLYVSGDVTNYGITSEAPSGYGKLILKQTSGQAWSVGLSSNDLFFYYGGTSAGTRVTFANGGNVGIGTTTPSSLLHLLGGILKIEAASSSAAYLQLSYNGATNGQSGYIGYDPSANMTFFTNNTERMRITSGGDICINSTNGSNGAIFNITKASGSITTITGGTTSAQNHIVFANPNGNVGSIQVSGSATSYNTSSDYRLKQDIKDFNGLDLVSKLKAYDYEWKSDKTRSYGVIAHELQSVINYAVTGVKDGKDMQGVDYSKIVPVLIKAIQELNDKIK